MSASFEYPLCALSATENVATRLATLPLTQLRAKEILLPGRCNGAGGTAPAFLMLALYQHETASRGDGGVA